MTNDEHQRERMRHWSRAFMAVLPSNTLNASANTANDALAYFDASFPAPSAAASPEPQVPAPVEPVADAHRDMTSVYQIAGPELASLRQKARLWDAANGWQPIETAKQRPADGQHLFYWFDPGRGWHVGVYYAEDGGTFQGRSGFCDHHDATHWMPLPAPPQEPTPQ